ncbi:MAG TPA: HicB family toxin-antitoxin system [Mycobacterium sp.]
MHRYKVEVTREGRWSIVHIPEIEGLTQARRLTEAPAMAREYIALDRGIPLREINVEISSVRIEEPDFRELLESATQIKHVRAQASELEKESAERARDMHIGSSTMAYLSAISPLFWRSLPNVSAN